MRVMKYILFMAITTVPLFGIAGTLPSKINWLPESFSKSLSEKGCEISNVVEWAGGEKLKARGLVVGQFAASGQYDIAVMCSNKIYFYWGGPVKCSSEIRNLGESIESPGEEEVYRYLSRYKNESWPKELSHDPIGMYNFGKSSFYQYCFNGQWLYSDGAD